MVTAAIPTDRSKSVRNRCVIKKFGEVLMSSRYFLNFTVGVGVFVTGLSQISSVLSFNHSKYYILYNRDLIYTKIY